MSLRPYQGFLFVLLCLLTVNCGSSDPKSDSGADAETDAFVDSNQTDGSGVEDSSVNEDDASIPHTDEPEMSCPNGIREEERNEQCDDGNFFDDDGCTRLCEYSCETDSDCDDLDLCNGVETCNAEHQCVTHEFAADGENCGVDQSCFVGRCKPDTCGDRRINENLNEECDDGNADDTDGCTRECQFTCSSDEDCLGGDICFGATECNTQTHKCQGDPLDDKTTCTMADGEKGWCFHHVCVPAECGDGEQGGGEECDLGEDNGKPGSTCSANCRDVVCGDDKVVADEECDDGDRDNYDGCDENCRTELFFRWNRFELIREPAPEWCKYAGENAFGKAFPGEVEVLGVPVDVLGDINARISTALQRCSVNVIAQFAGLDQPSFEYSDDSATWITYFGELDESVQCSSPLEVDSPFYISQYDVGGNASATQEAKLIQRPGVLKTESTLTLNVNSPISSGGVMTLRDFQFLLDVDMNNRSTPEGIVDTIRVPDSVGGNRDDERDEPSIKGRICAALDVTDLANTPVTPGEGGGVCCSAQNQKYVVCEAGDVPGEDCDSALDIISGGCFICPSAVLTGALCDSCDTKYEVVHATTPDLDVDEDGKNDAYTVVIAAKASRIRSLGMK